MRPALLRLRTLICDYALCFQLLCTQMWRHLNSETPNMGGYPSSCNDLALPATVDGEASLTEVTRTASMETPVSELVSH